MSPPVPSEDEGALAKIERAYIETQPSRMQVADGEQIAGEEGDLLDVVAERSEVPALIRVQPTAQRFLEGPPVPIKSAQRPRELALEEADERVTLGVSTAQLLALAVESVDRDCGEDEDRRPRDLVPPQRAWGGPPQ